MPLINSIQKDSFTVLKTYSNKSGNNIVHVIESKFPGLPVRKKVVCCDAKGIPYRLKDFTNTGVDVYEKAKDGTTVLKTSDGKINKLVNLFMDVCSVFTEK